MFRALPAILILAFAAAAQDAPKREAPKYETKKDYDRTGINKFYFNRQIAHVMGWQGASWLERPERVKEEEPAKLIEALDVKPGMTVADVGAGSGYHAFLLSPLVGDKGLIIASDIQPEMIKMIEDKAKMKKVTNIKTVKGTNKDPKLPAAAVDLIIMVDVYHEFEFPFEMTEKLVAALKPEGRLVFVEFMAEDDKVAILPVHKMSERQVLREMGVFKEMDHTKTTDLSWQHVITFTKKEKEKK